MTPKSRKSPLTPPPTRRAVEGCERRRGDRGQGHQGLSPHALQPWVQECRVSVGWAGGMG